MIGNDMWNLKASLALRTVARSARYIMGGIYPHSACRFGQWRAPRAISWEASTPTLRAASGT